MKGRQLAIILAWAACSADAAELQNHDAIREAAHGYALEKAHRIHGEAVAVRVGRLDRRLRLTRCDKPLEVFDPPGSRDLGNTTVGVRCNGAHPWTLYVPVTIDAFAEVVVAATPLSRGETLDATKVKVARYNLAKLPQGYFDDPTEVIGMRLRRNLTAGQPLVPAMLKAQRLIQRGQRVTMVARGNGLEVRMPGEALAHGARGQRIRVRNLSSKKVVEGVVTEEGEVRVDL